MINKLNNISLYAFIDIVGTINTLSILQLPHKNV